jgi:hypothetical protein
MSQPEARTAIDLPGLLPRRLSSLNTRKLRLFACACCRRIWPVLLDERCRQAVDMGERYADGKIDDQGLAAAREDAEKAYQEDIWPSVEACIYPVYEEMTPQRALSAAKAALWAHTHHATWKAARVDGIITAEAASDPKGFFWKSTEKAELTIQANFLGDLAGIPARAATFDPAWRNSATMKLAQTMYDDRSFDRLPILADALQAAGCNNSDILEHCRRPGVHIRGCWVLDMLLKLS